LLLQRWSNGWGYEYEDDEEQNVMSRGIVHSRVLQRVPHKGKILLDGAGEKPPQPGGQGTRIYSYIYIYIYIPQVQDGPVQCQSKKSKSQYDWRSVNQHVLMPSPLGIKVFHPNEFQSHIRRCTLKQHFLLPLGELHVMHAVQWSNFGTNSAFGLGPRKTMENLDRVGRSQDLLDANWLLASSPALNKWALTLSVLFYFSSAVFLFLSFFLWKHLQVVFTKMLCARHTRIAYIVFLYCYASPLPGKAC
jgi:hypothetical protein